MQGRSLILRVSALVAMLLASVALPCAVAAADTDPDLPAAVDCPAFPAEYVGADAVAAELRELRREQAAHCAAVVSRLARSEVAATSPDGNLADLKALLSEPLSARLTTDGNQVEVVQRDGDPGILVRADALPVRTADGVVLAVNDAAADGGPGVQVVELSSADRGFLRSGFVGLQALGWYAFGGLLAFFVVRLMVARVFGGGAA